MLASRFRAHAQLNGVLRRTVTTLSNNSDIKAFPAPHAPGVHILTYLNTDPPNWDLAIGTTNELPPTPKSFKGNDRFLEILNDVLRQNAHKDDDLKSQAQAFASPGGSTLGSGGVFFPQQRRQRGSKVSGAGLGGGGGAGGGGAGGASAQGGAGGGGVGGWVHLSDRRNPPDFGRIAWPEDILGSVEVDSHGNLQDNFQPSGTYRVVTNEGILGLTPFIKDKLVQRLREEERKAQS
ncbi:uncharacterized protein E0L32_000066 [Thyridium curvatum]|uniref:Uncharacterized protein n=1 Tax=Thyridium curvatum TaxID=1093900 RepID=A0A507B0H0_9PEZI|nr:uncharacterized protein E0L32_000066 [Thyridium curvatum]TPX15732.1 hypothetical protein E0L32_000066 [Thyridium curvatum]